mmetsp:Transcript_12423/g.38294  ORF Transcript_12423/g.38294 Transcript_12423/m.38294 type:complete len:215 (-) Transcript_12423:2163-2807(-)
MLRRPVALLCHHIDKLRRQVRVLGAPENLGRRAVLEDRVEGHAHVEARDADDPEHQHRREAQQHADVFHGLGRHAVRVRAEPRVAAAARRDFIGIVRVDGRGLLLLRLLLLLRERRGRFLERRRVEREQRVEAEEDADVRAREARRRQVRELRHDPHLDRLRDDKDHDVRERRDGHGVPRGRDDARHDLRRVVARALVELVGPDHVDVAVEDDK